MNDLIRRKDAIDALGEEPIVWDEWKDEYNKGMRTLWAVAKRDIESLPSIDAVPVKHGRWKYISFLTVECSECKTQIHDLEYSNFCPNCGAKMDETVDE